MSLRARMKSITLPHGRHIRTLPLGIGRGINMGIDFQRGETRLYLGLYEAHLNRHLRRLARPGAKTFDVGGHLGYDALVISKLTHAPIVSIESEARWVREMEENFAANPGRHEIDVVEGLVGQVDEGQRVTLDRLAEKFFVPDFIKMDIEGAEVEALEGARSILASRGPAILLEVHGKDVEWECLSTLRAAGYDPPLVVERRRWLPEQRPLDHNRWLIFDERA